MAAGPDCETFKTRLTAAIHGARDKVALPQWQNLPDNMGKDNFSGIVGLDGYIWCHAAGGLRRFDVTADVSDDSPIENARRLTRFIALADAALCAAEGMKPCAPRAQGRLFDPAYRDFIKAKRRGEESPTGMVEISLAKSQWSASTTIYQGVAELNIEAPFTMQ